MPEPKPKISMKKVILHGALGALGAGLYNLGASDAPLTGGSLFQNVGVPLLAYFTGLFQPRPREAPAPEIKR